MQIILRLDILAYCSGRGTYKSGICECDSDYFGIRCECDAENLVLGANLEDGCRPDNTTTTLCNNRGDCTCGKCECHPRENPFEVNLWILLCARVRDFVRFT